MARGEISIKPLERPEQLAAHRSFDVLSQSLLGIMCRHRWTVLLATLLGVAGGVFYLQHTTPLYSSTSKVLVEQAGPQVFERDTSGVISRWDRYLYTQAEQLKSADIIKATLDALTPARLHSLTTEDNPVAVIRGGLEVVVGRKDEIIYVSFLSPDPNEAAQVVNTLVDSYIAAHETHKRNILGEVVRILKEERTKRYEELQSKHKQMVEFKQQNEGLALGTDENKNVILLQLERLMSALIDAQLATIECRSFYETALKVADEPSSLRQLVEAQQTRGASDTVGSESASLRAELDRLVRDKQDLLGDLTPNHPRIIDLETRMQQVRHDISQLDEQDAHTLLTLAEQEYLRAKANEEELQRHVEKARQEAVQLNKQVTQYTFLESDYEQMAKLCPLLDDSIQRLDVTTEVGALNISVIEDAEPALKPSHPQKARAMSVALALGLLAGVGLAFIEDAKDQRLHSSQEISSLLGLSVLGAVPSIRDRRGLPSAYGRRIRTHPHSLEAEAFRAIRTAVFFGTPGGEAQTILITSPAEGEGKSTIVANLAIAMAQTGQSVLILDADFRRPMQDTIFGVDRRAKGLSLVLAGGMSLEEAIEHTDVENLDVLTCGPNVPNPAEILNSGGFSRLLAKLSSQYDRILIDSPPVVSVTDAKILAALCNVTVLVLRAESSKRSVTIQAREGLASVGANVLGVVVNDVPRKGDQYSYCSGYLYYGRNGSPGNGHRQTSGLMQETLPPPTVQRLSSTLDRTKEAHHDLAFRAPWWSGDND